MSQLESLRNSSTRIQTHKHTQEVTQSVSHTLSVSHYLSLSDTSAYSQSLELSVSHACTKTYKHTILSLGTVPLASVARGEKMLKLWKVRKWEQDRERASDKERLEQHPKPLNMNQSQQKMPRTLSLVAGVWISGTFSQWSDVFFLKAEITLSWESMHLLHILEQYHNAHLQYFK